MKLTDWQLQQVERFWESPSIPGVNLPRQNMATRLGQGLLYQAAMSKRLEYLDPRKWEFTLQMVAGTPTITAPTASSTVNDYSPQIVWGSVAGADLYEVQIDSTLAFASPDRYLTADTEFTPRDRAAGAAYIRVRASDNTGINWGSWSSTVGFTIAAPDGSYIYYATAGNDTTGDGSIGNPYATPGKAASVASAGDTILGNGGDTFTLTTTLSSLPSGGANNITRFGSYGTGNVIWQHGNASRIVTMSTESWIKFVGITLTAAGGGTQNAINTIRINGAGHHIFFDTVTVDQSGTSDVSGRDFLITDVAVDNVHWLGCTIDPQKYSSAGAWDGITLQCSGATNISVQHCTIKRFDHTGVLAHNAMTAAANNFIMFLSVVEETGGHGAEWGRSDATDPSGGMLIDSCIFRNIGLNEETSHNSDGPTSHGAFRIGGLDTGATATVQNCLIYKIDGWGCSVIGGCGGTQINICSNLIARWGLNFGSTGTPPSSSNNNSGTVQAGFHLDDTTAGSPSVYLGGCIFINTRSPNDDDLLDATNPPNVRFLHIPSGGGSFVVDHNLYYAWDGLDCDGDNDPSQDFRVHDGTTQRDYSTITAYLAASATHGFDANGKQGNPNFTDFVNDDFTYTVSSPMIGVGDNANTPQLDYTGAARDASRDIGPYEYIASITELSRILRGVGRGILRGVS